MRRYYAKTPTRPQWFEIGAPEYLTCRFDMMHWMNLPDGFALATWDDGRPVPPSMKEAAGLMKLALTAAGVIDDPQLGPRRPAL